MRQPAFSGRPPPANAVIAIESLFPALGLALQDGTARNRAVNTAFYFTGWRCRFITAHTGLSTIFSPGDTLRGDNLMKSNYFRWMRSFRGKSSRATLSGATASGDLEWSARDANGRVAKAGIWQ
ncbi:MAG: hypothetical protein WBE80_12130 [Methylocella sp.]